MTCQILGFFDGILAANDKCPVLKISKLMIPIQEYLSQKQNNFSEFFREVLKSRWTFEHFEKKHDPHRFCIFEITDSKNTVWYMSKKSNFRGPIAMEHGKRAQKLLKSAPQHLFHIYWSLPRQLNWKKDTLIDMINPRVVC